MRYRIICAVALGGMIGAQAAMAAEVEREMDLPAGGGVTLRVGSGEVKIATWEKPTLWVKADVSGNDITFTDTKGVIEIGRGVMGDGEFEIKVPAACNVNIQTSSADVETSGAQESLTVETSSGDIKSQFSGTRLILKTISGQIEATAQAEQSEMSTASGDVKAQVSGQSLRVETVSGQIELDGDQERTSASTTSGDIKHKGSSGQIQAASVSGNIWVAKVTASANLASSAGDIEAGGLNLTELRAESIGGNVRYHGTLAANSNVDVSTKAGNIDLALPAETPARYDLRSFSGTIKSAGSQSHGNGGPGKRVEYVNAAATALVSAKTFSGNIRIGNETE